MRIPKLRTFREKKNMTVDALAGEAEVSARTVYNAERGLSCNVSTAKRLARAVGAKLDDMKEG